MAPRSSLVAHGQVVGPGWFDVYRAPLDWTTLCKNLTVHTTAGTGGAVTLWFASAGRSVAIWSIGAAVPGIYVFPSQVTLPGQANLTFQLLTALTLNYAFSGSLLQGNQPFPPQGPLFVGLDDPGYGAELTPLPAKGPGQGRRLARKVKGGEE